MSSAEQILQSTALSSAVAKLLDVVEQENTALRQQKIVSHSGFTDRKHHALMELTAARRVVLIGQVAGAFQADVQRLAVALSDNAMLLKRHITAVGEISDIIIAGLRDASSDGTYSRSPAPHQKY